MDRQLYKRWADHPVRQVIKRAAAGDTIRPDELDDLRLPPRQRRAMSEAVRRAPDLKGFEADQLSAAIVESLPVEHETREQFERRRAEAGDADAMANIRARQEARSEMADRIMGGGL